MPENNDEPQRATNERQRVTNVGQRATNAGQRVTNAEIKRDLQRIEGRVLKTTRIAEQLEPIIPDLAKLAANADTLLNLAKESDDKTVTFTVLRRWSRWDTGTRTFFKMVFGALIVAICTVIVYSLFHLTPLGGTTTPPHPTPVVTPITTPVTVK
jgi:hypothetical protein